MSGPSDARFEDWVERARGATCRAELERRGLWIAPHARRCRRAVPGLRRHRPVRGQSQEEPVVVPQERRRRRRDRAGAPRRGRVVPRRGGDPDRRAAARRRRRERGRPRRTRSRGWRRGARDEAERARRSAAEADTFRRREQRGGVAPVAARPAARRHGGRGLSRAARAGGAGGGEAALPSRSPYFAPVAGANGGRDPLPPRPHRTGAAGGDPGSRGPLHRPAPDLDRPRGRRCRRQGDRSSTRPASACRRRRCGARSAAARSASPGTRPTARRRGRRGVRLMGEGIETALSAWAALPAGERAGVGVPRRRRPRQHGGQGRGRLPHPTDTKVDAGGRTRRVFVADAVPAPDDDTPLIGLPDSVDRADPARRRRQRPVRDRCSRCGAPGALRRRLPRHVTVRLAMARAGRGLQRDVAGGGVNARQGLVTIAEQSATIELAPYSHNASQDQKERSKSITYIESHSGLDDQQILISHHPHADAYPTSCCRCNLVSAEERSAPQPDRRITSPPTRVAARRVVRAYHGDAS